MGRYTGICGCLLLLMPTRTPTRRRGRPPKPKTVESRYLDTRINLNISLGDLKILEALLPENQPLKHRFKATILRTEQKQRQR